MANMLYFNGLAGMDRSTLWLEIDFMNGSRHFYLTIDFAV